MYKFDFQKISMKSAIYKKNGAILKIPVGFSWTTFFLGCWPSVFRCHWKMAWTLIVVDLVAIWFTTEVFRGNDFLLAPIILRGVAAYFRNVELGKEVHKHGWRSDVNLAVVRSIND